MIESRIEPERIVIRDVAGDIVFSTDWTMAAVLAQYTGSVNTGGATGATSGYDTPHITDHDIGAAPPGAQRILAFIELDDGKRQEFSGSLQLGRITYRRNASWARIIVFEQWLAPIINAGRVVLRERWWLHGGDAGGLYGWPGGLTILPKTFQYDVRILGFVGGAL